jgi:hypothetical protein
VVEEEKDEEEDTDEEEDEDEGDEDKEIKGEATQTAATKAHNPAFDSYHDLGATSGKTAKATAAKVATENKWTPKTAVRNTAEAMMAKRTAKERAEHTKTANKNVWSEEEMVYPNRQGMDQRRQCWQGQCRMQRGHPTSYYPTGSASSQFQSSHPVAVTR